MAHPDSLTPAVDFEEKETLKRPGVVLWFKIYCVSVVALHVLLLILALAQPSQDPAESSEEAVLIGIFMAHVLVHSIPVFAPAKLWVWIYGIVLLSLGILSCVCAPVTLPLLIFWLNGRTMAYFEGRRASPSPVPARTAGPSGISPDPSVEGVKRCPSCGNEINSRALLCRFCKYKFREEDGEGRPGTDVMGVGFSAGTDQEIVNLEVKLGFFPLAFLFLFCTPTIVINGEPHRRGWGTHFFELTTGRHTIEVFVPYLFWPRCGANSVKVILKRGRTRQVSFYMPPWVFSKGRMSVT